jgi:hypothetical protein
MSRCRINSDRGKEFKTILYDHIFVVLLVYSTV